LINWFLLSASIISLVGMVFHGVAGQKIYMGNINRSDLESLTKSLSLVSWHIFTIFLLVSAIALAYVAYYPEFVLATYPIIGVNALGSALFGFLGVAGHRPLLKLPGAYLMGGTALLALLGL
jgi:hypothetical protein